MQKSPTNADAPTPTHMHFWHIKKWRSNCSAKAKISKGVRLAVLLCEIFGTGLGAVMLFAISTRLVANADGSNRGELSADQARRNASAGMVWIASGTFMMGTNDERSFPNERPAHLVEVQGFWMDEYDVTNAEFAKFVEATGYVTTAERKPDWEELKKQLPPDTPKPDDSVLVPGSLVFTPSSIKGRENHPVVQISWHDAVAYAKWTGKRLPSEAEWEYAARGSLQGKRFVWGDEFRPNGKYMANTWQGVFPVKDSGEDGFVGTSPVGSFPPNGYGLYDMAGNVWQWCSDWYRADTNLDAASKSVCRDPRGPAESYDPAEPYTPKRVVKGGSFLCNPSYCESYRPSARRGTPPDTGSSHTGFRCVMSENASQVSDPSTARQ
jgi:sulfatase modifying factor 1